MSSVSTVWPVSYTHLIIVGVLISLIDSVVQLGLDAIIGR